MQLKLTRWFAGLVVAVGLSACGGGGGGGTGGGLPVGFGAPAAAPPSSGTANVPTDNVPVVPDEPNTDSGQPPVVSKPEILFVAIPSAGSILSFQTQNPKPGSTLQAKAITGFQSLLGEALAYDETNDRLYASVGPNILVFDKASTLSGNASQTRTIDASSTGITVFSNIFLDKKTDTLYLGGSAQNHDVLAIIGKAGTATGSVVPDHVYAMASGSRGFAFDTQRKLMYGLGSTVGVFVFDLTVLQEMQGNNPVINQAVRVIGMLDLTVVTGVAIDPAKDRLYAAGFGKLAAVDNASTAVGNVALQSISISAHSTTFDPLHDRLYVGGLSAAYIINDASTLKNGFAVPATIALGDSQNVHQVGGFAFP